MTMFTELYALATTATLSLVISADEKRGMLSISVMPKPKKDAGEPALTKDLTLTATPAEFDDGFVVALKGYREARAGLIEQAEATKEVLQAAKEAAAKKAAHATTKVSKPERSRCPPTGRASRRASISKRQRGASRSIRSSSSIAGSAHSRSRLRYRRPSAPRRC